MTEDILHEKCIVNDNDMYIYAELISEICPDSILDVGMFLKRIGAVSRQIKDMSFPDSIQLDGVDAMTDCHVKVYDSIYDNVKDMQDFMQNGFDTNYDIAFLLRPESIMTDEEEDKVWDYLLKIARYIVTDCETQERINYIVSKGNAIQLNTGSNVYALMDTKVKGRA